jgi:hypothetical protein
MSAPAGSAPSAEDAGLVSLAIIPAGEEVPMREVASNIFQTFEK